MKARVVVCVIAAAVTSSAVSVAAAPKTSAVSCTPTTGVDIACRVTAKLGLNATLIGDNNARSIGALTAAVTSTKGSADLFFKKTAICRMAQPTVKGTALKTRTPTGYLFTQARGKTLCTFSDYTVALVTGSGRLPASALASEAFFAGVEALPSDRTTQFRASYEPNLFAVGVLSGGLLVRLPDDELAFVDAGEGLTLGLRNNTIVSRRPTAAKFDSSERSVFAKQLKLMG